MLDACFPHPLRYRQVWNTAGKRAPSSMYVWAAVPPSADFVAAGMFATDTDAPPEPSAMRCVPRAWFADEPDEALAPRQLWDDTGTGGRPGAVWSVGCFNLVAVAPGHAPPKDASCALGALRSSRFFLGEGGMWLPPGLIDDGGPLRNRSASSAARAKGSG